MENNSGELVLGIISTVGTDVNSVITCLEDCLKKFNYHVELITVSKDIISQFEPTSPKSFSNEYERISHYMTLGNKIRKLANDYSILMSGVAAFISQKRKTEGAEPVPSFKTAYIIKSIKNKEEIDFLRKVYSDGVHFLGVTSSRERRIKYLRDKSISESEAKELVDRDENEEEGHGQHTQEAFQLSDYFFNVTSDSDYIRNCIARVINLIFGDPQITPVFDEYAMFMAYASSLRSADLSRQVGAVIARNEEIISSGANDCPKYHGGLYWTKQGSDGAYFELPNGRDCTIGSDRNKIEQTKLIEQILVSLNVDSNEMNIKKVKKAGIADLTEYGRVVHAEMEALLMCARNNISCSGAELFVTTFPCHNCAKHIIAAGIKRVVYIEPYPKSKTFDFYAAEISDQGESGKQESEKVLFEPFVGVGPNKYIDLFAMKSSKYYNRVRKDKDGIKIEWEQSASPLRIPVPMLNYLISERLAGKFFYDETMAIKEVLTNEQD
jgi:deoxycytidylate deaminase